mgnify:CR=1 FL=1
MNLKVDIKYLAAALIVLTLFSITHISIPKQVLALEPPVAKFTHTPDVPLINQTVTFNASESYDPDGTIISYQWCFGDETPNASRPEATISHTYSALGDYTVTLTVTDNAGLKGTTSQAISINDYPMAKFTFSPTRPLVNETVTFNATESSPNGGTIVSYFWNFGDEQTANTTTPIITHAYSAVGNYTVTLTTTDSYGLTDNCTESITIIKPPVADFTFSPTWPKVGETVSFDASASIPNGGTIVSYFWDFGDGQNTTGDITTHAYLTYGNFTAALTITDSEGLTDTTFKEVKVREYPTPSFINYPGLPYVNEMVTLDASASTPNGGTIVSYFWDFGDGQNATGDMTTHAYTTYGTYYVTLTVTDSEELSNTTSLSIRVIAGPVANFTYVPAHPIVNQLVLFNATLSYDPDGSIVTFTWDFGDGNTTAVNQSLIYHVYAVANVYKVSLTIADDEGLTDYTSLFVAVYTPIHDVAIIDVAPSAIRAMVGNKVYINVTVENQGNAYETFNVTVYYDDNIVGTQAVEDMLPGTCMLLTFNWNTSNVPACFDYTIKAIADIVPGETDISDNKLIDGNVKINIMGDIDSDGKIDMRDVGAVARAFGSFPGHPRWDPSLDVDQDGTVNMRDVGLVAKNFGKTC